MMGKLLAYFRSHYNGELLPAPLPTGLRAVVQSGVLAGSTQCQCDCIQDPPGESGAPGK
jgi:hypothetical protein